MLVCEHGTGCGSAVAHDGAGVPLKVAGDGYRCEEHAPKCPTCGGIIYVPVEWVTDTWEGGRYYVALTDGRHRGGVTRDRGPLPFAAFNDRHVEIGRHSTLKAAKRHVEHFAHNVRAMENDAARGGKADAAAAVAQERDVPLVPVTVANDPREAAWAADDKLLANPGAVESTSDLLDRLAGYLDEAHAEEIEGDHGGDADHDGPAPEACSYCRVAVEARERAAALRAVRS